jgi:hypothetical protein
MPTDPPAPALTADEVETVLPLMCSYCSFELPPPQDVAVLQRHVETECEFHPIRRYREELAAERARRERVEAALRLILVRMPDQPQPDEHGQYGYIFLGINAPIWETLQDARQALAAPAGGDGRAEGGMKYVICGSEYVHWHDEAARRYRKGERQRRCARCGRWMFPNWPEDVAKHTARGCTGFVTERAEGGG